MKLKVMNYNILHAKNYITNEIDYDGLIKVIKEINPDVLSLNEVYGQGYNNGENQAKIIADKLGYNYFFGKATKIKGIEYGNALLSKYPIENPQIVKIKYPLIRLGKRFYQRRCIIRANIKGVTVLSTHFGLNKREQINATKATIKNIEDKKCILIGDLNMTPEEELISKIKEYLIDTDTMAREVFLTYPSDNPKKRLDYILVSKDAKILDFKAIDTTQSDHKPIESTIII